MRFEQDVNARRKKMIGWSFEIFRKCVLRFAENAFLCDHSICGKNVCGKCPPPFPLSFLPQDVYVFYVTIVVDGAFPSQGLWCFIVNFHVNSGIFEHGIYWLLCWGTLMGTQSNRKKGKIGGYFWCHFFKVFVNYGPGLAVAPSADLQIYYMLPISQIAAGTMKDAWGE